MRRIEGANTSGIESLNSVICDSMTGAFKDEIGLRKLSSYRGDTIVPRHIVDELSFKAQIECNWKSKQTALSNRPPLLVQQKDREDVRVAEQLLMDQSDRVAGILFSHRQFKRPSVLAACNGPSLAATRAFWKFVFLL